MQAVILAAGEGRRLRPLTHTTPKPLVPVCSKPLIEHILQALPGEITEILIVIGYKGEQIQSHLGNSWGQKPITYLLQSTQNGTGSALHLAKSHLTGTFLVVNADNIFDRKDLEQLVGYNLAILTKTTTEDLPITSALMDETGNLSGLEKNTPPHEPKRQVCGAYLLNQRFFDYPLFEVTTHKGREYSLPHTLLKMGADHPIKLVEARTWLSIGTPEELASANGRCEEITRATA